MKKRGVSNTVFVFMIALIVLGVVLIFGYQAIEKVVNTQQKAKYVTFKTDFTVAVEDIKTFSPGTIFSYTDDSREHKPLIMPVDSKGYFCVGDVNRTYYDFPVQKIEDYARVSKNNVIFYPKLEESFEITGLIPDPNPLCFKMNNGKLEFNLEYMGRDMVVIRKNE